MAVGDILIQLQLPRTESGIPPAPPAR